MSRKTDLLKELYSLVKALNRSLKVPREKEYGVCKKFITMLTDYFFTIIESGTTSFGNQPLITQQKENCRLIKKIGPVFIDFDEYPHYSGRETISFEKYVNEAIKCEHGYAYSAGQRPICKWVNENTWEIMKKCFPDATKIHMCPITVSCNECTYVQSPAKKYLEFVKKS